MRTENAAFIRTLQEFPELDPEIMASMFPVSEWSPGSESSLDKVRRISENAVNNVDQIPMGTPENISHGEFRNHLCQ